MDWDTCIPLIVAAVAIVTGLTVLIVELRADKREYVWFHDHPFVGTPGGGCLVWDTSGHQQCLYPAEDHVYNREDARHEW